MIDQNMFVGVFITVSFTMKHATVVRDRATGRKLDVEAEQERLRRSKEEESSAAAYTSGLVQQRERERRREEERKEQTFSRSRGDAALNRGQRQKQHWDDPLYKVRHMDTSSASTGTLRVSRALVWENRYGIAPGRRWDGIDRTNGWERKRAMLLNERQGV